MEEQATLNFGRGKMLDSFVLFDRTKMSLHMKPWMYNGFSNSTNFPKKPPTVERFVISFDRFNCTCVYLLENTIIGSKQTITGSIVTAHSDINFMFNWFVLPFYSIRNYEKSLLSDTSMNAIESLVSVSADKNWGATMENQFASSW